MQKTSCQRPHRRCRSGRWPERSHGFDECPGPGSIGAGGQGRQRARWLTGRVSARRRLPCHARRLARPSPDRPLRHRHATDEDRPSSFGDPLGTGQSSYPHGDRERDKRWAAAHRETGPRQPSSAPVAPRLRVIPDIAPADRIAVLSWDGERPPVIPAARLAAGVTGLSMSASGLKKIRHPGDGVGSMLHMPKRDNRPPTFHRPDEGGPVDTASPRQAEFGTQRAGNRLHDNGS